MSHQWILQKQDLVEAIRFFWIINQVLDVNDYKLVTMREK